MSLSSLRLWHKLLLLGLITLLLCAVPTALFVRAANKEIRVAQMEIQGLAPSEALVRVIQNVQSHSALGIAASTGGAALEPARVAKAKEVFESLAAAHNACPVGVAALADALRALEGEWQSLADAYKDRSFSWVESHARHAKLVASVLKLLDANLDHSGLTLDPEPDSYYLMLTAFQHLPRLTENLSRMRGVGTGVLAFKQVSAEERVNIATHLERARDDLDQLRTLLGKILEFRGSASQSVNAASKLAIDATQKLIEVTDLEFVRIEVLRLEMDAYGKLSNAAIDAQFNLSHVLREELELALQQRVAKHRGMLGLLLVAIAVLLALGVGFMYWLARSITRPLHAAVADADAIATGNLGVSIASASADEVGQLRGSMRRMQMNLANIVSSIRQASESVGTAASEIAQSTQDMSTRAESQASSLEQTAASMEELNTSFQKNDESNQHVNALAAEAAAAAEQGGVVVGKVTHTMQDIDASSKKISEIIGVIDSIAFQTNILALNAAVEAARAGEQGRGFAVVAAEVRALAQRSADAAKEIRVLIADSVKKVQAGTRESAESRKAMDGILVSVRKVASTMAEMQTVREDQRRGVSQVSRAVEQMNQGTQQSAAMVEEIAATADMLSHQAETLIKAVAAFNLGQAQERRGATYVPAVASAPVASTESPATEKLPEIPTLTEAEIAREIAENWRAGQKPQLPP